MLNKDGYHYDFNGTPTITDTAYRSSILMTLLKWVVFYIFYDKMCINIAWILFKDTLWWHSTFPFICKKIRSFYIII